MQKYIDAVRKFHEKYKFAEHNGHNMFYRMNLLMEELGEICECITKDKPKEELAEEHADLLILLLGNCIACNIDIEKAFWEKLDKIMDRPFKILPDGTIRVTNYKGEN